MAKERILIVENESSVARDIRNSLQAMGYVVTGLALSGKDAVQKALAAPPDLVLMAVRLQGEMDGIQAADQIRAQSDIPVVYLTAFADQDTLTRAKLTGPFGYVIKPFEERELQATIEMALYKHELDRKLKESERWLAATLRCMGDAVIATDPNGRIQFMNPVAESLTGWKQAQVLGKELSEAFNIVSEETRAVTETPVAQALQQGAVIGLMNHTLLITRDGHEIPIDDSAAAIKDDQGSVTGVVLVFRDITERRLAEKALYQYARRLTTLHAIDRAILSAQSSEEIAQATLKYIVSLVPCQRTSIALFDLTANDAVLLAVRADESTRLAAGTHIPLENYGVPAELRQGQHHLVNDLLALKDRTATHEQLLREGMRSFLTMPLVAQGELMGALNLGSASPDAFSMDHIQVARQVADQLAIAIRQAHLREEVQRHARELAALNKAGQAIVSILDKVAVLELVIAEVRNLLGAEGVSVLLCEAAADGDPPELVFAASTGPGAEALVGARMPISAGIAGWVLKEKQSVLVRDARDDPRFYNQIDDLTRLPTHSIMAVPLIVQNRASGVIEVVNKATGIFTRHDLELLETMAGSAAIAIENARLYKVERDQLRRLKESQARLIQAEKMAALGRLIASITHEINNPLQAIQNCLTLAQEELLDGPRPQELQRYLRMADEEIGRIANIIRRMRDFYRPEREEMQTTDVRSLIESVLELIAKQSQHSQVTIEHTAREMPNDLPTVRANPGHLKQVFLNLALNAIDSMTPQGGTLRVRTALGQMQQQDQVVPAVHIEFGDSGHGMSPEVISQIFEPFFTTKSGGTGLGLAISYEIIQAHHGQITVKSQVGVGTTFTILLPLEQP